MQQFELRTHWPSKISPIDDPGRRGPSSVYVHLFLLPSSTGLSIVASTETTCKFASPHFPGRLASKPDSKTNRRIGYKIPKAGSLSTRLYLQGPHQLRSTVAVYANRRSCSQTTLPCPLKNLSSSSRQGILVLFWNLHRI